MELITWFITIGAAGVAVVSWRARCKGPHTLFPREVAKKKATILSPRLMGPSSSLNPLILSRDCAVSSNSGLNILTTKNHDTAKSSNVSGRAITNHLNQHNPTPVASVMYWAEMGLGTVAVRKAVEAMLFPVIAMRSSAALYLLLPFSTSKASTRPTPMGWRMKAFAVVERERGATARLAIATERTMLPGPIHGRARH